MEKMTLREIQLVGLDILKDIHGFCMSRGIRYTLFGGTMLGAIRHKGFIPWDDDVDIAMPREDYDRFVNEYSSIHGYSLFCPEKGTSWLAYARVCDMEKTLVINDWLSWCPFKTGVWVDIFPMDGAPDDITEAEDQISRLKPLWKKIMRYRLLHGSPWYKKKSLSQILRLSRNMFLNLFDRRGFEEIRSEYIHICKEVPFGSTGHYSNYSFLGYGIKEYQSISDFDTMINVPFEDTSFQCIGGYHSHMTNKYGDYMVPPKNKDQSGHGNYGFYWIKKG